MTQYWGIVTPHERTKRARTHDSESPVYLLNLSSLRQPWVARSSPSTLTTSFFVFVFCCYVAIQLACQLHQEHTQVVCSNKETRKHLARRPWIYHPRVCVALSIGRLLLSPLLPVCVCVALFYVMILGNQCTVPGFHQGEPRGHAPTIQNRRRETSTCLLQTT